MKYFAYGSNMDEDWLQQPDRCPSARFLYKAKLTGYRLAFTRTSSRHRCGVADILVDPLGIVWGIVYEIKDEEWPALDEAEGVPYGAYRPLTVTIQPDGKPERAIESLTYEVVTKITPHPKPNAVYKKRMLDGAEHVRLPADYIEQLRAIEIQP